MRGDYASRMNGYAVDGRMDGCQQMISGKWKIRINSRRDGEISYLVNGAYDKAGGSRESLQERQEVICHRFKDLCSTGLSNTMLRSGTICYCFGTRVKSRKESHGKWRIEAEQAGI